MTIDPHNYKHIIADNGKTLVRILDGQDFGPEVYLGINYFINGSTVAKPYQERASEYMEVDIVPEVTEEDPLNQI